MKNLVCTLETAKKLKEAGWEKETKFYWYSKNKHCPKHPEGQECSFCDGTGMILIDWLIDFGKPFIRKDIDFIYIKTFPAPTLQEILDELPVYILINQSSKNEMFLNFEKQDDCYKSFYTNAYGKCRENFIFYNSNPTEAAALLWLKLKEEKPI